MARQLKITLVRSPYGHKPNQRLTLEALGLRKTNASRTFTDNPALRGMIDRVKHLVNVEKV